MGPSQALVGNRLLSILSSDDYMGLQSNLDTFDLEPPTVLIGARSAIEHVYFPESGIVSALAETSEGRIEIGMVGREGMVGLGAALGTDRTPHLFMVQGIGRCLRISTQDLQAAIAARPSTRKPFTLYALAFLTQVGQTAYANAAFTLEARLARWILMTQDRSDGDDLLLTHVFLSAMLGVRRPGVTTAIHLLEGVGAIKAGRGRITVVNREKLCDLADDSYNVAEEEYERLFAGASRAARPSP